MESSDQTKRAAEGPNDVTAIAVVAMTGRFPGASTLDAYWRMIRDGRDAFSTFTDEELLEAGAVPALIRQRDYVRVGAVLDGVDLFDAAFFGCTPREAEILDPQHRIFLECAHEVLEQAGHDPERYAGRIGVFAGVSMNTYYLERLVGNEQLRRAVGDFQLSIGNDKDFLPTRISYRLNLKGPSIAVQTACSSSLVAIHLACQSLLNGECAMALAGGASISVPQTRGYLYQEGGIASPDGHCRPFDATASGTNRGNGVGVVLLKPLAEALADGDPIRAVIRASAINNDGSAKVGYTAPSVTGQARVIAEAVELAGVPIESIGYVEAHGTATPMGDPIELEALTRSFRRYTDRVRFCAIGSVKANIGHLDTAAGVAGFIKTVLAIEHGELPPSAYFTAPNRQIDFDNTPFYVPRHPLPWNSSSSPRRAGVSSFGIGGTNAHLILEEAPPRAPSRATRGSALVVLSARTEPALRSLSASIANWLRRHPEASLHDIAYTLHAGRSMLPERLALVSLSAADATRALDEWPEHRVLRGRTDARARSVAFLLPGQGVQRLDMGRELYETEEVFREELDRCAALLQPDVGMDVRRVLWPPSEERAQAEELLRQTQICQPALFAVEYALARLLISWGVRPSAMIGHSLGEYVAACLAGVFLLPDALALVSARGKLMGATPPGAMVAVASPAEAVEPLLSGGLVIAAYNAHDACVVAGPLGRIDALRCDLGQRGIAFNELRVSHAFHSSMMEGAAAQFEGRVRAVALHAPAIPFLSNVTGGWIQPEEATSPVYWARHLCAPVRFAQGLGQLLENPSHLLLEVGPGRALARLAARHRRALSSTVSLSTLGVATDGSAERDRVLGSLGRLWIEGAALDPTALHRGRDRRRQALPTYPFERRRYWVDAASPLSTEPPAPRASESTPPAPPAGWFYVPRWRRTPLRPRPTITPERVLVLTAGSIGARIAELMRRRGHDVSTAEPGGGFAELSAGHYRVEPHQPAGFERLLGALKATPPQQIIHAWTADDDFEGDLNATERAQRLGFHSLLALAQALGARRAPSPVKIVVLSTNVHAVNERGKVHPAKATIIGPIDVIPQELPGISCRLVDADPPPDGPELHAWYERIAEELAYETPERIVARRGELRWTRSFERVDLSACNSSSPLRHHGVYLITGGLGGLGLAIGAHLARRASARLVLATRSPFPPRESWPAWLGAPECVTPDRITDLLRAAEDCGNAAVGVSTRMCHPDLDRRLHALCASHLYHFLFPSSASLALGGAQAEDDIACRLGLRPEFARFFRFMLAKVEEAGFVRRSGDRVEGLIVPAAVTSPSALSAELLADHPPMRPLVELLEHCVAGYSAAISGRIPAISVLYPDGHQQPTDLSPEAFEWSTIRACVAMLTEFVDGFLARTRGKTIRILEVGGGSGLLLRALQRSLARYHVEYHFTDVGPSFVRAMERAATAEGLRFVKTGVVDIARPLDEQGYTSGSFDLILAVNVVHATPRIDASLTNLARALAPGGVLGLVESVKQQPWVDMIWGLADGWWTFEDGLRTRSPLLDTEIWERVLRDAGFEHVFALPMDAGRRAMWDTGLFLGQRSSLTSAAQLPADRAAVQEQIRGVQTIEAAGGEVLVVQADVANPNRMREVLAETKCRFGALHGVVHCAMVLDDGVIQRETPEAAARVLAPKVRGTMVLDSLLRDEPVDFIVLCSSLSAIMGAIGQADYSAASAFLDAYAHARRDHAGRRTVSIDWDRWLEVGAARRLGLGDRAPRWLAPSATPDGERVHTLRLRVADAWWLREHRIQEVPTLPGTAYLELVRAAFSVEHGSTELEIRDLVFTNPMTASNDSELEIHVRLRPRGGVTAFVIESTTRSTDAPNVRVHATGTVRALEPGDPPTETTIHDIATRCGWCDAASEADPEISSRVIAPTFGPRWSRLRWRRAFHDLEGLARIELPSDLVGDLENSPLHPALLDAATGFASLPAGDYIPLSYGRVCIRAPLCERIFSHIRLRANVGSVQQLDVRIIDESGRELITIDEYTLRRVSVHSHAVDEPARRLVLTRPGDLCSIKFRVLERQVPGPGEVELRVIAAALSFKDVLIALGALSDRPASDELTLGIECAGVVTAVGPDVHDLAPGDHVVTTTTGAFATHALAPRAQVFRKPASLTFEETVTLPVAVTTAWHALDHLARLRAGDRILIHAAAGGVGLAAVQIAQRRGAEVFATAGSDEKRAYLRSIGVVHVMDSRSLDFADEVLAHTGGHGVDVVVNSLSGEFITRSLEVLAPYGRFIELGKRDILANKSLALAPFDRSLSFCAIEVGPAMPGFPALLQEVLDRADRADLVPLPRTVFPFERAVDAFRHLAGARHIGKVVLAIAESPALNQLAPRATAHAQAELGIRIAEGVEAFDRILSSTFPQIVVSTHGLHARIAELEHLRISSWHPQLVLADRTAGPRPSRSSIAARRDAPATELQCAIAAIWRSTLGLDEIGIDSDFFSLNGDSLLAIQMLSRVRNEIGLDIPVSSFFANPTIRALTHIVAPMLPEPERTTVWRSLVPIRAEGRNPPFFCAAPLLGVVFPYFELARDLGSNQPFYALRPPGLEGEAPLESVEDLARIHVRELLEMAPEGPYNIGGWSFGCVVAFEMAIQLETAGKRVGLVAMFDFPAPISWEPTVVDSLRFLGRSVFRNYGPYIRDYLYFMVRNYESTLVTDRSFRPLNWIGTVLRDFVERSALTEVVPRDSRLLLLQQPGIRPMLKLAQAHQRAMMRYRPMGRLKQKIVVFRCANQGIALSPDLGWGALSEGGIEVIPTAGDHMTMLRAPHVTGLAEEVRRRIQPIPTGTRATRSSVQILDPPGVDLP
ncbi:MULTISPECIES: type I polyketide synthase [Sorangium]|uniref:Uncharacterized protein n=1 Tax=Sorangium cellulosum TaxID=56 RepID=A0A4P2R614_SORCE|nr:MULTISPECIES: type I polyketide synthase [Sorangium]AUX38594.1 uncharacterized protein SOCE836_108410 [Sorangium cellulosum]WCQ97879.1 zinc containing alcohol dehydrogenase superfamily protein [Sorangium sp. Soce836]